MAQRFEWAHASSGFWFVDPDTLDSLAPDGNAAREFGVAMGDEVMVYGSLDELHTLFVNVILRIEQWQQHLLNQTEDGEYGV